MNEIGNHKDYNLSYNIFRNVFYKTLIYIVTYTFPQQNRLRKDETEFKKSSILISIENETDMVISDIVQEFATKQNREKFILLIKYNESVRCLVCIHAKCL